MHAHRATTCLCTEEVFACVRWSRCFCAESPLEGVWRGQQVVNGSVVLLTAVRDLDTAAANRGDFSAT